MKETTAGRRSVTADLIVVALAACLLPFLLLLIVGSVLTGGPRVLVVALVALALFGLVAWWRWRRRASRPIGDAPESGWRGRMRGVRRLAEPLLAMGVATALAAGLATAVGARPPAQAEAVARFQEHRRHFETLREMALADEVTQVTRGGAEYAREPVSFPRPPEEVGIGRERAEEYRRLLNAVGCRGLYVSPDGTVSFPIAGWGMANRGWRMSLAWLPEAPSEVLPTVDGLGTTRGKVVHSHIEGDWYVAFIW